MRSNQTSNIESLNSSTEDKKIEVLLDAQEGEGTVTLKYSTWTEGLGWCAQKTIQLETDSLDDLHRALTVARMKINRQKADVGISIGAAKIIQLPTLA